MTATLPNSQMERAKALQDLLIDHATGGHADNDDYVSLRKEFIQNPSLKILLPSFVIENRDLFQFWAYIKYAAGKYQERRVIIWQAFNPLLDHLEMTDISPIDPVAADALTILSSEDVNLIWQKALSRRADDPDGAITSGRQLLEAVCKHILDDTGTHYQNSDDLPKLYKLCAKQLDLSPSQYTDQEFKAVLSGCHTVVQNIGAIRNKMGDAHGAGRSGLRAAPRHAALVVNLAGAMATFLMDTYQSRKS